MMTDPVADMLARIRNAAMARHETTHVPASKMKKAIAQILKQEGYIADARTEEWGPKKRQTITIMLKYGRERGAAFTGLKRVSRPGRRVYVRHRRDSARAQRPGRLHPEHVPRSDDGQGSPPAEDRRRAALRGLVMSSEAQTTERGEAVARRQAPRVGAQGGYRQHQRRQGRGPGAEGQARPAASREHQHLARGDVLSVQSPAVA